MGCALFRQLTEALAVLLGSKRRPFLTDGHRDGSLVAFRLLRDARVHAELRLSGAQSSQVLATIRAIRQKFRRDLHSPRSQDRERRRQAGARLMASVAKETLQALHNTGAMTSQQQARLQQIVWQERGVAAFADPAFQQGLALTGSQNQMLQAIAAEFARKVRESEPGFDEDNEQHRALLRDIRRDGEERAGAVLTPEQKQLWETLKGPAFLITHRRAGPADLDELG